MLRPRRLPERSHRLAINSLDLGHDVVAAHQVAVSVDGVLAADVGSG